MPKRLVEHGYPILDVATGATLHPPGLGVVEPRIDCRLKLLDLRSRRIELLNQSFLSGEVRCCVNDLFANRSNRSRNVFESSLGVVKLAVELGDLSLRCSDSRPDRV